MTRVDLKPGPAGKSTLAFAARGPLLALPDLAMLAGPVDVQLQRLGTGVCWGATFDAPFAVLDPVKGTLRAKN